jgi:tetratricopeptide (TPR) repeat protein
MSTSAMRRTPDEAAGGLLATLRAAPATVPALVAVALLIVWATSQAGYPVTHWAPGGLIVLALLGITLGVVGLDVRAVPLPVKIAVCALAGYTALSFASILWASVPGVAWEGANRTLLYLLLFALFALWPQRGRSAVLLLGGWTLAMIALAGFVALHVNAASTSSLQGQMIEGRLVYPAGYVNANAAMWLMAFWPSLLLARSERLPWGLRGLLAGGAVLLAEVALLSQSRGSLFATAAMLVLVFALLPGRVRTFAVLVPVAAGIGVAAPAVLRVGDHLRNGLVQPSAIHSATVAIFAAALVVGLAVALGAAIEQRRSFSVSIAKRIHWSIAALAALALVAILIGGLAAAGNPVKRIEHGWHTFKVGYSADSKSGSRLVSGLGSARYDFYRVALDEFAAHPLVGIGADNFQQQYLAHRRSEETPHYPHSVELRTLAETGLIGSLLALVGLGAALVAAARGLRGPDPLGRAVVAAALGGFAYWAVHGSVDWFWEFAGLGASAFALLGLACALTPRRSTVLVPDIPVIQASPAPAAQHVTDAPSIVGEAGGARSQSPSAATTGPRPRPARLRWLGIGVGVLAAVLAALSLAAPWLSQLEIESAARVWPHAPQTAYARLNDAASLNPLSDEPYLVAGSIALRFGDLTRADHEFALALERTPGDAYATLERGAIASTENEPRGALALLGRAARLNPRDQLTRQALQFAREGKRVNVQELNRSILLNAQQLK